MRHIAWAIVGLAVAAYVGVVGLYVVCDHRAFRTMVFDLGIYDQATWLLSQGKPAFVTLRGLHMFGDHTCFILWPIGWLYHVWDDVAVVLLLQTGVLALGAVAAFGIARVRLGDLAGAAFALAWLLNPAVQNLNLSHFHPESIASVALLFAFGFGMRRQWLALFLAGALAMVCKDDIAIATGALGAFIAWRWDRRAGLALFALSAAWFLLCMKLFLPAFNDVGFFRFQHDKWDDLFRNRFSPGWYARAFFNREVGLYLLHLLAPLAFLPLLAPSRLLLALPAVLINILSAKSFMISVDYHYTYAVNPFLLAAAVGGAERLAAWGFTFPVPFIRFRRHGRVVRVFQGYRLPGPFGPNRATRALAILLLLGATVWGNIRWSRLPIDRTAMQIREVRQAMQSDPAVLARREAVALIPPDAVVSSNYVIAPHLAHRERIYMFPNPFTPEKWGIAGENTHNPADVQYIIEAEEMLSPAKRRLLDHLTASGQFERTSNREGVLLYKRRKPPD